MLPGGSDKLWGGSLNFFSTKRGGQSTFWSHSGGVAQLFIWRFCVIFHHDKKLIIIVITNLFIRISICISNTITVHFMTSFTYKCMISNHHFQCCFVISFVYWLKKTSGKSCTLGALSNFVILSIQFCNLFSFRALAFFASFLAALLSFFFNCWKTFCQFLQLTKFQKECLF